VPERAAPSIPGVESVVEFVGRWPSFSDAEVLEISLRRKTRSSIVVHVWRMTSEVDQKGYYVTDHHAVVTVWLEGISDLDLGGFSVQNVIGDLSIERQGTVYRVSLRSLFGVGGHIDAERVSLSLQPGRPQDAVHAEA
jgi:hypothetical protein